MVFVQAIDVLKRKYLLETFSRRGLRSRKRAALAEHILGLLSKGSAVGLNGFSLTGKTELAHEIASRFHPEKINGFDSASGGVFDIRARIGQLIGSERQFRERGLACFDDLFSLSAAGDAAQEFLGFLNRLHCDQLPLLLICTRSGFSASLEAALPGISVVSLPVFLSEQEIRDSLALSFENTGVTLSDRTVEGILAVTSCFSFSVSKIVRWLLLENKAAIDQTTDPVTIDRDLEPCGSPSHKLRTVISDLVGGQDIVRILQEGLTKREADALTSIARCNGIDGYEREVRELINWQIIRSDLTVPSVILDNW